MANINLSLVRRKPDYYRNDAPAWVRNVWPRPESFNHFVKSHRAALLDQGAVVRLGRDQFINTESFPRVAETLLGVRQVDAGGDDEIA